MAPQRMQSQNVNFPGPAEHIRKSLESNEGGSVIVGASIPIGKSKTIKRGNYLLNKGSTVGSLALKSQVESEDTVWMPSPENALNDKDLLSRMKTFQGKPEIKQESLIVPIVEMSPGNSYSKSNKPQIDTANIDLKAQLNQPSRNGQMITDMTR